MDLSCISSKTNPQQRQVVIISSNVSAQVAVGWRFGRYPFAAKWVALLPKTS